VSENNNRWLWGTALGLGAAAALAAAAAQAKRRFDFAGKVILITGGSRGLGLVLAREFAAAGARLVICARDGAELARAREELQAGGAEVFDCVCDVRDCEQVNQMIDDISTRFGDVDVLINNAGVIQVGPLEVQTREDFENAMAVHFWGPFYTMQAVLPQMRRRGEGRIVNIASIGGKIAVPHLAPYCASKFALVGLSNALRGELAKDNIFVTTVCPGLMRTGSHINAIFKGRNRLEYALFSLMDALPLTSINVERAARQIVSACRRGDAELVITIQAQTAAKVNALFPELVAEITGMVNRLLPSAGGIGEKHAPGKDSASFLSPSVLTALADKASTRNNELKPGEFLA
jgi:NAD(P)-dependent dehydrogenase (short-subunit alcohol dehydrogenase family)